MQAYTAKQLAGMSGVTVRTLHHYDAIGLLKPAHVAANGYRHYGREELLRLQQILLHRELGLPLAQIALVLDRTGPDRVPILERQRAALAAQVERGGALLDTIDRTISHLKGQATMTDQDLYKGFAPEKQEAYEAWLVERGGAEMTDRIAESKRAVAGLGAERLADLQRELAEVERVLAQSCRDGVPTTDPSLDPLLRRHRDWVAQMWGRPCPPQAYAGLADLYLAHPDFVARYEAWAPGFAEFLPAAMKAWAARAA